MPADAFEASGMLEFGPNAQLNERKERTLICPFCDVYLCSSDCTSFFFRRGIPPQSGTATSLIGPDSPLAKCLDVDLFSSPVSSRPDNLSISSRAHVSHDFVCLAILRCER